MQWPTNKITANLLQDIFATPIIRVFRDFFKSRKFSDAKKKAGLNKYREISPFRNREIKLSQKFPTIRYMRLEDFITLKIYLTSQIKPKADYGTRPSSNSPAIHLV